MVAMVAQAFLPSAPRALSGGSVTNIRHEPLIGAQKGIVIPFRSAEMRRIRPFPSPFAKKGLHVAYLLDHNRDALLGGVVEKAQGRGSVGPPIPATIQNDQRRA